MYRPIPAELELDRKIIFLGDVSFNFKVFKLFFETYRELISDDTFLVLGNHELWNINENYKTIDEVVDNYRVFLSNLKPTITLLENQLWFPNEKKALYSEKEILRLSKAKINALFSHNDYAIFGGIGFAGNNKHFNQTNHIYQKAPITRSDEILKSKNVDVLHKKLKEIAYDRFVFFATHMPMSDWSNDSYIPGWTYLHGHTHKNYCCVNASKKVYANNQIGYEDVLFSLKYIIDKKSINLDFYEDGIHEISCREYIAINAKLGIYLDFNREYDKMYMIKKNGLYMFFVILSNCCSLKILCGGQIRNTAHDLQYYYDHLCEYAKNVALFLEPYHRIQHILSEEIKKIGGSGWIHGSIVDIDYYNHIFVNPIDGSIVPYYAKSMTSKYVYNSIPALLKSKAPRLYSRYLKEDSLNALPILFTSIIPVDGEKPILVEDTRMYSLSLKIKELQFVIEKKVIRVWSDDLIEEFTYEKRKKKLPIPVPEGDLIEAPLVQSAIVQKNVKSAESNTIKSQRLLNYIKELSKYSSTISVISYNVSNRKIEYLCKTCNFRWKDTPKKGEEISKISCPKCKNVHKIT